MLAIIGICVGCLWFLFSIVLIGALCTIAGRLDEAEDVYLKEWGKHIDP